MSTHVKPHRERCIVRSLASFCSKTSSPPCYSLDEDANRPTFLTAARVAADPTGADRGAGGGCPVRTRSIGARARHFCTDGVRRRELVPLAASVSDRPNSAG